MDSFFLQGLQHPLLTPAQLIVIIAIGLLSGQQGFQHHRIAIAGFMLAIIAGLITSQFWLPGVEPAIVLLSIAGIVGLAVAIRRPIPVWFWLIPALLAAFLLGIDSAPVLIPGLGGQMIYSQMAGSLVTLVIIFLLTASLSAVLNRPWSGILLRIAGSWIVASALMVSALKIATVTT